VRIMPAVEGKHVIVTGGGVGIGRAIAQRLARDGARVTLLARTLERLEEVAADTGALALPCDIRDRPAVDAAVDRAAAEQGPVYAFVANSGVGGPNEPGAGDRFDDLVQTNLTGTYNCLRAAQRNLEPGPDARHFVVIASVLARIGVPGYTGYCASKAGLLGLTRAFAAELAPENVQVNAICPGWVNTDMAWEGLDMLAAAIGGTREDAYRQAMSEVPMGRMAEPEHIAGTVAWLLGGDAKGVTGQAIDQNNGAFMI
jgi:NAD(P)-dependent dehydrogenase (short-subunit alcohol dehydrogenase family)